ncbi:hypothetical protein [Aromatoleum evansii]|jgi:hypothetical protein|uniref:hypothetical protein n=1 Tax=Aromatoleum evansii TaxID=59406 RepID=UPI00145DB82D|nr:hypothetical protein [Aromatoleum evansii]NMG29612.1 hypothetical protein [Aromatoleum evansii]
MLDCVWLTVILCSQRQLQRPIVEDNSSDFPQSALLEPLPVSLLAGSRICMQTRTTWAAGRLTE